MAAGVGGAEGSYRGGEGEGERGGGREKLKEFRWIWNGLVRV